MSKELTVGNQAFQYPIDGTKPGWGEEATGWAEAMTDAMATVFGPNDIPTTIVAIANNINNLTLGAGGPLDVGAGPTSLSFPPSSVRSFLVTYAVTRDDELSQPDSIIVESGEMEANYNGSEWNFFHSHLGDAGVDFSITPSGQIQYYSNDFGHGTIIFRAKTVDYN